MEERAVSSKISCDTTFVIEWMFNSAHVAPKIFVLDVQKRQISNALVRRRALSEASDQGLRYVSLHKARFRKWRH